MRNTLEQMEYIDNYIDGLLTPSERQTFERQLLTDIALNEALQHQMLLRQSVQQAAFRAMVNKAKTQYRIQKGMQWGLALLVLIGLAYGVYTYFYASTAHVSSPEQLENTTDGVVSDTTVIKTLPCLADTVESGIQKGEKLSIVFPSMQVLSQIPLEPIDDPLPVQQFMLNPQESNVLTTASGFVFAIAPQTFATNDSVEVRIREAVSAEEIILAGLSTESNEKALETAGMFEFYAYQGGELLSINKAILVSRGTDQPAENMMLFDGVARADGSINWVDPKPLRNDLPLVPLDRLDFIPQRFSETMNALKGNVSVAFRDSVYYTMRPIQKEVIDDAILKEKLFDRPVEQRRASSRRERKPDAVRPPSKNQTEHIPDGPYIDPAKIKTLYSPEFAQTFVATKAFEERLRYIHTTCNSRYIDVYLEHLDWTLARIDDLLYKETNDQTFADFAKRNEGGVTMDTEAARVLQAFYEKQTSIHTAALTDAYLKYKQLCDDLLSKYTNAQNAVASRESQAQQKLFSEEWATNYNHAAKQLGYPDRISRNNVGNVVAQRQRTWPIPAPTRFRVTAAFTRTGWKNFDQYLRESLVNRTDYKFKDKSGKTATIDYSPSQVQIMDSAVMQLTRCYYKPREANSYVALERSSLGVYAYNLNELYTYGVIYVAFDGRNWHYAASPIRANDQLKLYTQMVSRSELSEILQALDDEDNNPLAQLENMAVAQEQWRTFTAARRISDYEGEQLLTAAFPCLPTSSRTSLTPLLPMYYYLNNGTTRVDTTWFKADTLRRTSKR